jgi:hypothetical protein
MPIRPELKHFYGKEWQTVTRPRILERAKQKCEQCGKPNHRRVWVWRGATGAQYWSRVKGDGQRWRLCLTGMQSKIRLSGSQWRAARQIRVVLTIAHLNQIAGDDRPENLKALCQWCHLWLDRGQHRQTRATRKDAARPLLAQTEARA